MIEALGIVFGGVSRLAQHYIETKDKQKEREHEAVMYEKQIKVQEQAIAAEQSLRKMEIAANADSADLNTLAAAIKSQAEEAKAAGGWAASLSASVRPIVTYFLLLVYAISKAASLSVVIQNQTTPLNQAIQSIYTEFDGALLGSIVSFWFADRSLRKIGK